MKYRSADIVEPNGIRSARTDWWPVGIALSSVKRVPLRTRLQIGLICPSLPRRCGIACWPARHSIFICHEIRHSTFWRYVVARLIAPETRPIPDYLSIRSGRRGRVEFLIVISRICQRYPSDWIIIQTIRSLEFDYLCQSEILFRFNSHPCVVYGRGEFKRIWLVIEYYLGNGTWLFFFLSWKILYTYTCTLIMYVVRWF